MGKKHSRKSKDDLAQGTGDAAAAAPHGQHPQVTGPLSGDHPAEGQLREINPDPANRAGVRDTAGDRVDHG